MAPPMFEPFLDVARSFRGLVPTRLGRPHFNFITLHYMYLILMSIVGSVIIFPGGGLSYTNALFFSAGAATQSGLNPVNVNDLLLYQQVTLMLIACVCNPIFINTAVVFVRLYWFEKRFEHLVKEARGQRRSKSRTVSRTKSEAKQAPDPDRLEMGVAGRPITVLHATTRPNGMSGPTSKKAADAEQDFADKLGLEDDTMTVSPTPPDGSKPGSDQSDDIVPDDKPDRDPNGEPPTPQTPVSPFLGINPRLHREITFADEVPRPNSGTAQSPALERIPESSDDTNKHIQFLERQQRNAQNRAGTLRIPGPRDFDQGAAPTQVDDSDDELHRAQTRNTLADVDSERDRAQMVDDGKDKELNADDHPRRGITIDEPDHPGHHARDTRNDTPEEVSGIKHILSRGRSILSHRPGGSRGLNISDARGSMARTFNSITTARSKDKLEDPFPYLSWQATTGRNSAFFGLTEAQREELGGIEYRALKTLAMILIIYFVGFHLLGMIVLLPWIVHVPQWRAIVESDGVNPVWWGFFTPASMFNDLGFTLTSDSMNSFQSAVLPLLFGSFLIIIGNTGFPCMLRFVIWIVSKVVPFGTTFWEELRFLLDHPRRCFTLLFPSKATWWLFWVLVLLNGIDLIFFIILDLNDKAVTDLPPGIRVLDGWFQAVSTRTAGFGCVNLAYLHPAIQVSYLIMMYISVFPIAISVRRTNVYEEKSLGIWGGEEDTMQDGEQSYVGQHLRRQLSFDLWYVFLGFFIICIVEGSRLSNTNDWAFTMFSVLFEIVSAYGTVGLSLGYPNVDTSFSAQFHVLSKLVIIAMMLRGRHRGLPYALDRAILLPSEGLRKKDEALATVSTRRGSMGGEDHGNWNEGDLDEYGLPEQHTDVNRVMTNGEIGEPNPENARKLRRLSSAYTTASGNESAVGGVGPERRRIKHERSRSLSTVIAGGFGAGPTFSKI